MTDQTKFKLVPANPTPEMCRSAPEVFPMHAAGIWRKMLAAAPPAPVVEVTDEQCVQAYRIRWAHEPLALEDIDDEDIEWAREWLRAWQQVLDPQLGMVTREELERLRAALRDCAQKAEALKMPCGDDPESAQAVRNSQYQAISSAAHLALGTIKGPEMYVTREELARAVEAALKEGLGTEDREMAATEG